MTNINRPWFIFGCLLILATIFILFTSQALPERLASHFTASGRPNGFMPRSGYVLFMLGFGVGLPLMMTILQAFTIRNSPNRINLPNRAYWLAPERREETIAFLVNHMVWFGSLLVIFLCFVHWLVVVANSVQPPHLSPVAIITGLVVFIGSTIAWTSALFARFQRRS